MRSKWWILIVYMIILIIGIINKEFVLSWLKNSDTASIPLMFFLSAVIASIPIIPFTVFAGLMGAKYGVILGLVINWFGGVSAAVIYYLLARYFFGTFFRNYLKKYQGIERFQTIIEKNAFIAILVGRMIAIIPPPVLNIYSGVSNISFFTFVSASAIGKLPPMFLFAYIGEQIFSSLPNLVIGIIGYSLFLLFVLFTYKVWLLRKSSV